jgi:hypothetical protein
MEQEERIELDRQMEARDKANRREILESIGFMFTLALSPKLQGSVEQGGIQILSGIPGSQQSGGGGAQTITNLLGPAVRSASDFSGTDAAQKIEAAAAALSATGGGTIDCRCLTGTQVFGTDPFVGMTTQITVLMGPATFISGINLNVPANVNLMMLEGAIISMSAGMTFTIFGGLAGSSISQHFAGDGSISFKSGSVREIYPHWWGAVGDGVHDDTAAIQATYNAAATTNTSQYPSVGGLTVYFPAGMYKITSQITQNGSNIYTRGAGNQATLLKFAPTANGTCFVVKRPDASSGTYGGISDLQFFSSDKTYVKTALNLVSVSEFFVQDVSIFSDVLMAGGIGGTTQLNCWSDPTNSSIGIQTNGHEAIHLNRCSIFANRPIYIAQSPFLTFAADLFRFDNLLLVGHANPCIEVQPNIQIGRMSFGGYQCWVAGTDGFRYLSNGTGPYRGVRLMLRFDNVGREQAEGAASHAINIQMSGGDQLFDLTIRNFTVESLSANGILLRGVVGAMLDTCRYLSSGVGLDVDSTCSEFVLLGNSFTEQGGTISVSGLTNFLIFNKQVGILGINTFDISNPAGSEVLSLPNLGSINALTTAGVSKRLLSLNSGNLVAIDADAVGTVVSGALTVGGPTAFNNNVTMVGRFQTNSGGYIASAAIITLPAFGNFFSITGTVTITNITTTGWQGGSVVTLLFTQALTLRNGAGGAGQLVLRGLANLAVVAGTTHTFVYDGNISWYQVD